MKPKPRRVVNAATHPDHTMSRTPSPEPSFETSRPDLANPAWRGPALALWLLGAAITALACRPNPASGAEVQAPPPASTPAPQQPPQGTATPGGDKASPAPGALPPGVDAKDLDPDERRVLGEILDEQFDPCGKPRSFRASLVAKDCPGAPRLAELCVKALQKGRSKREVVAVLLREIERLNSVVSFDLAESPGVGDPSAKVTVVVFSDFECPYCRKSADPMRALQKKHGYRLFFKYYPLKETHPNAEPAARAAFAAHKQGRFWEMHDLLFANQTKLEWKDLAGYARKLGLDPARFKADADSEAARKRVDADIAEGDQVGIDGTPTVYVNGRRCDEIDNLEQAVLEASKEAAKEAGR